MLPNRYQPLIDPCRSADQVNQHGSSIPKADKNAGDTRDVSIKPIGWLQLDLNRIGAFVEIRSHQEPSPNTVITKLGASSAITTYMDLPSLVLPSKIGRPC
jgi:hypothetical protein